MAKLIVAAMVIMFVVACGQKTPHYANSDIPPGYRLVCSEDGGHYTFIEPGGWMFIYVYNTKYKAIDMARSHYNKSIEPLEPLQRDQYTWHVCETN